MQQQGKLEKERALLQARLDELAKNKSQYKNKSMHVRLRSPIVQVGNFWLSYMVPSANWQAEYKFHYFSDKGEEAQFEYGAIINQNTGED